ncbi:hypothetical protein, variant [Sphaeroforma arctica JP610]|uniref:Protein LTV1 homolog n=1 Tax=Sphaeroforma arctica JP610 TaxID=667725 RepID=A0A0L0FQG0_9EUKA|nr:hypothetical protein, variant [Sphaeroforma arctica JP610]KNC79020.1 hypothetical protein, variant [Sphaeroforma arctica JP610]|eukprot:XP_014152922.1 hypothetical protein, variant [Sphaeroforma arctica JP610]
MSSTLIPQPNYRSILILRPNYRCAENARKSKQAEQGIYYDDNYDYLKHLKTVGEDPEGVLIAAPKRKGVHIPDPTAPIIDLPADVFASETQNEVGMLNLAAPRTGLNVDVDFEMLAQLDSDAEHDDEWAMGDDFIELGEGDGEGIVDEGHDDDAHHADDTTWHFMKNKNNTSAAAGSLSGGSYSSGSVRGGRSDDDFEDFADEEVQSTTSRFTEYSMTSSVMHRNDKLQLLDDQFESIYAQYDEEDMGELDEETTEGRKELDDFNDLLDEFMATKEIGKRVGGPEGFLHPDKDVINSDAVQRSIAGAVEEVLSDDERTRQRLHNEKKDEWIKERLMDELEEKRIRENNAWDCETIVSTYSNIYNHPTLIKESHTRSRRRKGAEGDGEKEVLGESSVPVAEGESVEIETGKGSGKGVGNVIVEVDVKVKGNKDVGDSPDEDAASDSGNESGEDEEPLNKGQKRDKTESKAEKKARKAAVKQERHARRANKKTTKGVYKQEELRQEKLVKGKVNVVDLS